MLSRRGLIVGSAASLAVPRAVLSASRLPHGHSIIGTPKYGASFSAFDYVNPDAPKGGLLELVRLGSFGTVNTLRYPGRPAADIRLVYDRLVLASDDEIASYYGLLAEGFAVADDFTSVEFGLEPDARWQDGRPVTAADVAFTLNVLKSEGAPFYRQALAPLRAEILDAHRLVVRNERAGDRDLLRKLATIAVHPSHLWGEGTPETIVGSGPLRVERFVAGRQLELRRDRNYWAAGKAVNVGRWNFDRVLIRSYRDANVAFEAFKAGESDMHVEADPLRWRRGFDFPAADAGRIARATTAAESAGQLNGLVFNLRRPVLALRSVREALVLAYDFETVNYTIFGGFYEPLRSVFAGTPLEASGPASVGERAILAGLSLAPGALDDPDPLPDIASLSERERLARASQLLDDAGALIRDGVRLDPDTGRPLAFDVLVTSLQAERVLPSLQNSLRRIGVTLRLVTGDSASLSNRMLSREFDLATLSWAPARLPGTAERLLWHSARRDEPNSYALSGLNSRAVDAAIEALEQARTRPALKAAGRAFDRAFRHELALLPLWRDATIRFAWWRDIARPAREAGLPPSPIDRWWAADTSDGRT